MARVKWADVVAHANGIVRSYSTGVTLRQLFYRLVSDGTLPNTTSAYTTLSARTTEARRYGGFPALVDRTRRIARPYCLDDPDEAVRRLTGSYRRDRTDGQPESLYVGVEKDALSALLERWLDPYGIPVLVMRGWHSESYERSIARDLGRNSRPSILLYFGDLDPAGEGIEANIVEHIPFDTVDRIALTLEQAEEYGLPENAGVDDKLARTPGRYDFEAKYGRLFQIEIDALPPDVLETMVTDAIDEHLDRDVYESILEQEAHESELLSELADRWTELREELEDDDEPEDDDEA